MPHRPIQWTRATGKHPGDNHVNTLEVTRDQTVVIKLNDLGAKLFSPVMRLVNATVNPADAHPVKAGRVYQGDVRRGHRKTRLRPDVRIGQALSAENLLLYDLCADPVMALPCRGRHCDPALQFGIAVPRHQIECPPLRKGQMGMLIRFQGGFQLQLHIDVTVLSETQQRPVGCDLAGMDRHCRKDRVRTQRHNEFRLCDLHADFGMEAGRTDHHAVPSSHRVNRRACNVQACGHGLPALATAGSSKGATGDLFRPFHGCRNDRRVSGIGNMPA